ncbi:MAG: hypothetical protein U5K31_05400 [Balneolaceae bacterium]|nr:hypothetical protein [Balneolaceae bacterium]
MTLVEGEEGNVLYTGDYRTPPSPASEGFRLPGGGGGPLHHGGHLLAFPIYRWPSSDALAAQVRGFALKTLQEGATPVFLAYSLGKAQEVMHLVAPLGQDRTDPRRRPRALRGLRGGGHRPGALRVLRRRHLRGKDPGLSLLGLEQRLCLPPEEHPAGLLLGLGHPGGGPHADDRGRAHPAVGPPGLF